MKRRNLFGIAIAGLATLLPVENTALASTAHPTKLKWGDIMGVWDTYTPGAPVEHHRWVFSNDYTMRGEQVDTAYPSDNEMTGSGIWQELTDPDKIVGSFRQLSYSKASPSVYLGYLEHSFVIDELYKDTWSGKIKIRIYSPTNVLLYEVVKDISATRYQYVPF